MHLKSFIIYIGTLYKYLELSSNVIFQFRFHKLINTIYYCVCMRTFFFCMYLYTFSAILKTCIYMRL